MVFVPLLLLETFLPLDPTSRQVPRLVDVVSGSFLVSVSRGNAFNLTTLHRYASVFKVRDLGAQERDARPKDCCIAIQVCKPCFENDLVLGNDRA